MRVAQRVRGFRECDDLTLTMRDFAIPRSATQVKRNTMQSGHTVTAMTTTMMTMTTRREDSFVPFLSTALSLVLSRGYALALAA